MALTGYYKTLVRPRLHRPLSMLKYDPVGTLQTYIPSLELAIDWDDRIEPLLVWVLGEVRLEDEFSWGLGNKIQDGSRRLLALILRELALVDWKIQRLC